MHGAVLLAVGMLVQYSYLVTYDVTLTLNPAVSLPIHSPFWSVFVPTLVCHKSEPSIQF